VPPLVTRPAASSSTTRPSRSAFADLVMSSPCE
jgi:hypothetical protein